MKANQFILFFLLTLLFLSICAWPAAGISGGGLPGTNTAGSDLLRAADGTLYLNAGLSQAQITAKVAAYKASQTWSATNWGKIVIARGTYTDIDITIDFDYVIVELEIGAVWTGDIIQSGVTSGTAFLYLWVNPITGLNPGNPTIDTWTTTY